ncbi:androglobin [Orycteropus afer afer]|uniref:Androglobin n=1 Tax=Orycteropus afer afer TaxID=1230840 RepID=A0A8B7A0D2_ORYAF|nr:androglobin [Orycteropus afer afer]
MTSKQAKKKEVHRINSAHGSDKSRDTQYFFSGNVQSSSVEPKKGKFPIWPEWSEADVNAEKWDAGKAAKEKDKMGKSPVFHFFEDPEGKIELPPSLKIYSWKRPQDIIFHQTPVVVKNEIMFDLFSANEHLLGSECLLVIKFLSFPSSENIFISPSALKDGFNRENILGYSIHVAHRRELGEFTVIHALTGWIPEVINLHELKTRLCFLTEEKIAQMTRAQREETWGSDQVTLTCQQWSEEKGHLKESARSSIKPERKSEKADAKDLGKKRSKDGEKEKEKFKFSLHGSRPSSDVQYSLQSLSDCSSATQPPHMVVYATFTPLYLFEKKIFSLEKMADSAEKLREYGLSHICSHPVLVTRTRSCPLIAPSKPPPIPPWKLIRQKKETVITDEPQEPIMKKPEQFLEISSPFLNYRMNPFKIPTETHYVQSLIKKGVPLGSGLSPLSENDEMANLSLLDVNQVTGTLSQGNVALQVVLGKGKDEQTDLAMNDPPHPPEGMSYQDFISQTVATQDKSQEELVSINTAVSKETWLDYEDFCVCFQNIYIFHKPSSYCVNFQKTEFKFSDERVSYYLFVDSLKPIELLVCFSALVRWGESGALTKDSPPLEPGLLMAETYSWKSLKVRKLVLKIHTYATKATMVRLPVGRHMLLFTVHSPVGHCVQICSMVTFVVGEEDVVLPNFEPESYRFTEQSLIIMKAIGNVIANFKDKAKLNAALKDLQAAHYPVPLQDKELTAQHFRVFHMSLWRLMKKVQVVKAPLNFKFAFRAMVLDLDLLDSSVEESSLGEWADVKNSTAMSEEVAAAIKIQAMWRGTYVRLLMKARIPDTKENIVVSDTLQKVWALLEMNIEQYAVFLLRLMFKSKCKSIESYPCYQDEETKIAFADYTVNYPDQPPNSWFIVFREIFLVPQDMIVVPKVYTTLPVCMLHVVNNDTMEQVPKLFQKVVPYLYTKNKKGYTFVAEAFTGDTFVSASRWKLRIIGPYHPLPCLSRDPPSNTFAMKEIKDYYIPNDKSILFRYSVKGALPHPVTVQVRTSKADAFIKLQILENEETIVSTIGKGQAIIPAFNFLMNEKDLSSQSSKQFLSHTSSKKEQESCVKKKSAVGSQKSNKSRPGSAVLDISQTIMDDEIINMPTIEESPSTPQQIYKYIIQCLVLYNSWPLTESQLTFIQALKDLEKNDIKAHSEKHEESITLGSPDSHAISEGQKSSGTSKPTRKGKEKFSEKEKMAKEKPAPRFEPQFPAAHAQQDDPNKPYWILRLVTETNEAEFLEVKKDTERADEIRAMKQAWEMTEPGRAIKVAREPDSRSTVSSDGKCASPAGSILWKKWQLSRNVKDPPKMISSESGASTSSAAKEEREQSTGKENIGSHSQSPTILEISPQLIRKELEQMDLSQYIQKTSSDALLQTEELNQLKAVQKAEEVHQFRQYRMRVLSIRDIDQEERLRLKDEVLHMYGEMRNSSDEARQKILNIREEYRNKLLEAERLRLEALAAEEAAIKMESEKKTPVVPDTQKKKKGKKK